MVAAVRGCGGRWGEFKQAFTYGRVDKSFRITLSRVPKLWITHTEAARNRHVKFKPDHLVLADHYTLDGNWLTLTASQERRVVAPLVDQVGASLHSDCARVAPVPLAGPHRQVTDSRDWNAASS